MRSIFIATSMKKIFLFILLAISAVHFVNAQTEPCKQTAELIAMLKKYHVQPILIDDTVCHQILKSFYKSLDVENVFFIESDIKLFESYVPSLVNNNFSDSVCQLLSKVSEIYAKRLISAERVATKLLESPFNYNESDSMLFSREYIQLFAETEEARDERWKRKLKYSLIETLVTQHDSTNFQDIDSLEFAKMETDLRAKLLKREKRLIQHIIEYPAGTESLVAETFLTSIANRFDPHTFYFTTSAKADFLAVLSTESKSFGLVVNENKKGEIFIEQIIPGSPAFHSGLLHQGDIILQLIKPDGNVLDMTFSSQIEASSLINTAAFESFTFVIRNINGLKLNVPLQKEIIKVESNNTNGYLLNGTKKIAYVALPDFYTNGNELNPKGVAYDVAKELTKLKKKKIEGLILDLRFNGGGSMQEAVELCGLFIDEGPLFMIKFLNERAQVIKDTKPGTSYNGPLVILVNELSASASEIVAATLQDYNRAVIVGSKTYGKATAQYTLPLDSSINIFAPPGNYKKDAFINITMEKMYRISGKSLQKTGLTPDIEIPDVLQNLQVSEATEPYALKRDSVTKKSYLLQLPSLPNKELKKNSKQRIQNSEVLCEIQRIVDSISNIKDSTKVLHLNFSSYLIKKDMETELTNRLQMLVEKESKTLPYSVVGKYTMKHQNKKNKYKKALDTEAIKQIKEDAYIREAYYILNDLINYKPPQPIGL